MWIDLSQLTFSQQTLGTSSMQKPFTPPVLSPRCLWFQWWKFHWPCSFKSSTSLPNLLPGCAE